MRHAVRRDNGVGHQAQGRVQRESREIRLNGGQGYVEVIEHVQVAIIGSGGHGFLCVAGIGQLDEAAVGGRAAGRCCAVDVVEADTKVGGQQDFHLKAGVVRHRVGVSVRTAEAKLIVGVDGNAVTLGVRCRATEAEAEHIVLAAIHVKAH